MDTRYTLVMKCVYSYENLSFSISFDIKCVLHQIVKKGELCSSVEDISSIRYSCNFLTSTNRWTDIKILSDGLKCVAMIICGMLSTDGIIRMICVSFWQQLVPQNLYIITNGLIPTTVFLSVYFSGCLAIREVYNERNVIFGTYINESNPAVDDITLEPLQNDRIDISFSCNHVSSFFGYDLWLKHGVSWK